MRLDLYLHERPRAVPADDESDVFVALVRSAIILVIMFLPVVNARQVSTLLQGAAIVAAIYTLALFIARLRRAWLPWQRFLAVCVDLLLVTAAVMEWPTQSRTLFQLYYLVVVVAAMWFGRHGAVSAALGAIGAFVVAQYATSDMPVQGMDMIGLLWENGAPVLLILALVSSYLLRVLYTERAPAVRLQHEFELARDLQMLMLPDDLPKVPGYSVAVRMEAAHRVSGDLYGFAPLDENTLLLFVADDAGKGVYGVMNMSLLLSHLKAAAREGLPPAQIAARVNRDVYESLQPYSFASAFIAKLDLRTGMLGYVNCGHPPPLVLRAGDPAQVQRLSSGLTMIGVTTRPAFVNFSVQLQPGDTLIIFTDGITEARNRKRDFFTEQGVIEAVRGLEQASAEEVAATVMQRVRQFCGGELEDDAIVLVLRRHWPSAESGSHPAPAR